MHLKIYAEGRCPNCGRTQASERIRRGRLLRLVRPKAQLMQCRLCQARYLVRTKTPAREG